MERREVGMGGGEVGEWIAKYIRILDTCVCVYYKWPAVHNQNKQRILKETFKPR